LAPNTLQWFFSTMNTLALWEVRSMALKDRRNIEAARSRLYEREDAQKAVQKGQTHWLRLVFFFRER
jgi:hypothetical protein